MWGEREMSETIKDNPLVAITLWFRDGAALRQVFTEPVSQGKAMAGLGHMVAELGGELNIEIEHCEESAHRQAKTLT